MSQLTSSSRTTFLMRFFLEFTHDQPNDLKWELFGMHPEPSLCLMSNKRRSCPNIKKKEIQVTQNALANGRSSLHDSCRRAVVILDRKFQEIAMLASWRPHGASSFRLYYIFLYFFFNPLALLDNSLSLATTPNLLTNLKYTTFPPHISTIFHHCL